MVRARVFEVEAASILTPTGGYLAHYTHSLHPYRGCQYGCDYCYVREMTVQRTNRHRLPWSGWIEAKTNAPALLRREAERGRLGRARIFCSSSTDPYTPLEGRLGLTRRCLEVMVETPPAALVLQTRAPLVERDAALLARIPTAVVSMTLASDDEAVRRRLEPDTAPAALRARSLARLRAAGVRTQAALAPLLPCDPARLADLVGPVAERVIVDDFFRGDGAGGRRSARTLDRLRALGYPEWAEPGYAAGVVDVLRARLGAERVLESQAGFNELGWVASGQSWAAYLAAPGGGDQLGDCAAW